MDKINHGLGIKNIENTLRRYEGYAEYKIEDNCFVSEIMVKVTARQYLDRLQKNAGNTEFAGVIYQTKDKQKMEFAF